MGDAWSVEAIHIAPVAADEVEARDAVEAVAGRGLVGDRYFDGSGTFARWERDADRPPGYQLTLIEAEAVEAIEREAEIALAPGEHRRNITTRNVPLNHLVDRRFRIGDVVCIGVRLCEPCAHLQSLTEPGTLDALVHRGGLRADILEDGTIRRGDRIDLE